MVLEYRGNCSNHPVEGNLAQTPQHLCLLRHQACRKVFRVEKTLVKKPSQACGEGSCKAGTLQ